jgi:murein L,D-transpeptidase YcbB/YkuD
MKIILVYAVFMCSLFVSCNAQDGSEQSESEQKGQKKVSKRDRSITKANSYSDLFVDSLTVEKFIADKKIPDSLSRRIRSFYNTRNYQFAWFTSKGLTEQARGFWNLHDYHTTYNHDTALHSKALQKTMDNLIAEDELSVSPSNKTFINTELTLTNHFIQYVMNQYEDGYVKRKEMERFIPRKREDALYLADSLLTKKHKDNKYFEDINESYKALKDQLGRYYEIAKKGGWPSIPTDKKTYKKGMASPAIALIKRHLQIIGDMPAGDTSQVFTDTLEMGIQNYQRRFGYTPDGKITAALLKEMNVPVQNRVQQLLINMERMRWMPSRPSGNLILVNIPEFVLHLYDGKNKVWDMNVVVGKEGHNTMMFTGDLNQVVFSPYWNVPPSIVKNEILPSLAKDPNYLVRNNMEQVGMEGDLPKIRQLPGPDNSLGRVKFLFPNSFNIYFHDTNAKGLFSKDKRAYSHGCIRLEEPEKMANYLLRNQPEWTPERIEEAMNSGTEKYVKLKNPIPVFISYYTAWVDDAGQLNFREDIYGHDEALANRMFTGGGTMIASK